MANALKMATVNSMPPWFRPVIPIVALRTFLALIAAPSRNTGSKFKTLLEIIMRRHELKSTLMTSNRPLEDWGKLMGDVPAATAILDRFLQSADVIEFKGRSYRLKQRGDKAELKAPRKKPSGEAEG